MPEPHDWDGGSQDPKGLFLDYLDYYRSVVTAKVDGMTDEDLRKGVPVTGPHAKPARTRNLREQRRASEEARRV